MVAALLRGAVDLDVICAGPGYDQSPSEVIFAGCIPVMISDKWELPFEDYFGFVSRCGVCFDRFSLQFIGTLKDFLDVTRFVIKWPSTQIGPQ